MKIWRAAMAAMLVLMMAGAGLLVASPDAAGQTTYYLPDRSDDPDAPCPAGQNVTFRSEADPAANRVGLRYCTAPAGWIFVTSQAECAEAFTNGVQSGNQVLANRGWWAPEIGMCWGGGDYGANLTQADCGGALFFQNVTIQFPNPLTGGNTCIIPVYKAAPVTDTLPGGAADPVVPPTADANGQVAIEVPAGTAAQLDPASPVEVGYNPLVFNGLLPADRIIRFTYPAGLPSIDLTIRAVTTGGQHYVKTFTVSPAAATDAGTPAAGIPTVAGPVVVDPTMPPPADLDMALRDPYECGGGFTGEIENGTPPFRISYRIDSRFHSADLGTFVSLTSAFSTPDGYLDYSTIPAAAYSVSVRVRDSSSPARSVAFDGFATELITDACGTTIETPPAVPLFAATAASENTVGLAVTGPTSDAALVLSQLLLAAGVAFFAAGRIVRLRRSDD